MTAERLAADCWHDRYYGAPSDGSAWTSEGECDRRVLRGGFWFHDPANLRAANRFRLGAGKRNHNLGFRFAIPFRACPFCMDTLSLYIARGSGPSGPRLRGRAGRPVGRLADGSDSKKMGIALGVVEIHRELMIAEQT